MAREKNIYKPLRRKHGEGTGKFATIGLKQEVADEFKFLVKAYSDIYGQKMTPTQVIKRLMDAGVKRCDPNVYAVFSMLKKEGTPEPIITHPVDPTEGDIWDLTYFFEKDGEQLAATVTKNVSGTFSAKLRNRCYGLNELFKKGWRLFNDAGIEISQEQAKIIAEKIREHKEETRKTALERVYEEYEDRFFPFDMELTPEEIAEYYKRK